LIEIWNPAAEELFGWRRDEVVGAQSPLVPPDLKDEWNAIRDEVFAGGVIRSREVRGVGKDGTMLDLALRSRRCVIGGGRLRSDRHPGDITDASAARRMGRTVGSASTSSASSATTCAIR